MKTRHLHLRQLNSLNHFLRVHFKQITPILRLHSMSCWSSWQWGWQGLLTENLGQFYSHIGGSIIGYTRFLGVEGIQNVAHCRHLAGILKSWSQIPTTCLQPWFWMKNLCNHCSSLCMTLPVMVSRCPELSLWCLEFPWSSLNSRLLPDIFRFLSLLEGPCKAAQLEEVIRNSSFPYFSAISLQSPFRTAGTWKRCPCRYLLELPQPEERLFNDSVHFAIMGPLVLVVSPLPLWLLLQGKVRPKELLKGRLKCPSSRRRAWPRKSKWLKASDGAQHAVFKVRWDLMGQYQVLAFYGLMLNACLNQLSVPVQDIREPGV